MQNLQPLPDLLAKDDAMRKAGNLNSYLVRLLETNTITTLFKDLPKWLGYWMIHDDYADDTAKQDAILKLETLLELSHRLQDFETLLWEAWRKEQV